MSLPSCASLGYWVFPADDTRREHLNRRECASDPFRSPLLCEKRRGRPRADLSWRPIHFGGYVIMAPSVSTGDGGRKVAGEYLVAEPLDYFHFAEAPVWGLRVGVTARSRNKSCSGIFTASMA